MSLHVSVNPHNEPFSADVLRLSDTGERWILFRIGSLTVSFPGYDAESVAEARALAAALTGAADQLEQQLAADESAQAERELTGPAACCAAADAFQRVLDERGD
jgi:hypothetical protein